jgi:hypothetical protein
VTKPRGSFRFGVALVAAWLLVLQGVVGAFAVASAPQVDAFGNPLCATGVDGAAGGSHGAGHFKLPGCCTAGCSMFAPALPSPSQQAAPASELLAVSDLPAARPDTDLPPARDHNPGNPRAPPPTA